MTRSLFVPLSLCLLSHTATAQLKPTLNRPVVEGQKKVAASVHQPGKWRVEVHEKDAKKAEKTLEIGDADPGMLMFDFTADIAEGLKKDWVVKLFLDTAEKDKATVQANAVKIFLHPPKEGDQVVKGTVLGMVDKVRVEVFNARGNPVDMDTASVNNGDANNPGKQFTAGMNRRLAAGQTVRVTAMKDDAEVGATTDFAMVETAGFDWGRVRAYFSAGATVAQEDVTTTAEGKTTRDRKFQSADYFVGLNVDYNWLTSLKDRFASPCLRPAKAVEELKQLEDLVDRWDGTDFKKRIGGFEDIAAASTRLEAVVVQFRHVLGAAIKDLTAANQGQNCLAIEDARTKLLEAARDTLPAMEPVEVDTYRKGRAGKQEQALRANAERAVGDRINRLRAAIDRLDKDLEEYRKGDPTVPRGGRLFNTSFEARLGQAPVAGAMTPTAPATILQSSNAGYIGLDLYAPWWPQATSWRFRDGDNALFMAPLVRLGLLATTNGPVDVGTTGEKPALFRHLYGSHAYGVRFGHFALDPRGEKVAPELISFLDVTYGRFDNFRHIPESSSAPSTTDHVPRRTEFHGRFKIPETPIYVGFTANIGAGKDDMRFFFGTRFDVSKVLSKLVPASE